MNNLNFNDLELSNTLLKKYYLFKTSHNLIKQEVDCGLVDHKIDLLISTLNKLINNLPNINDLNDFNHSLHYTKHYTLQKIQHLKNKFNNQQHIIDLLELYILPLTEDFINISIQITETLNFDSSQLKS